MMLRDASVSDNWTPDLMQILRALSTLRGLRGAPEVPPLCREAQSLGQQMSGAPLKPLRVDSALDYPPELLLCAKKLFSRTHALIEIILHGKFSSMKKKKYIF